MIKFILIIAKILFFVQLKSENLVVKFYKLFIFIKKIIWYKMILLILLKYNYELIQMIGIWVI